MDKKTWFKPRRILSWIAFGILSLLLAVGGLLGLDLYLHHKFDHVAGLNYRGYRGPVLGEKAPGEIRLAVVGGSTAFGYGVKPQESFPAALERALRQRLPSPVTVINLAYNNQGSYSFKPTLEDYAYLDYDAVILYEGYNDLKINDDGTESAPNTSLFRHDSPIFRLFGYFPIFPVIFAEKAMALRNGGDLEGAYRGKTVFRPPLTQSTQAGALEAAVKLAETVEDQLQRRGLGARVDVGEAAIRTLGADCPRWTFYCGSVRRAIDYAVGRGKKALFVSQPAHTAFGEQNRSLHADQQTAVRGMLRKHYSDHPLVGYADLSRAVDLQDPNLAFDGMHLVEKGNRIIAEKLVEPVQDLLARRNVP